MNSLSGEKGRGWSEGSIGTGCRRRISEVSEMLGCDRHALRRGGGVSGGFRRQSVTKYQVKSAGYANVPMA